MAIRDARESDFDAIAEITNHYILHTPIHFSYEPVSPAELRDGWRAGIRRHPFLVHEENGAVVAYAKSGTWRTRTAYDRTAEVGIYVRHGLTGRGVGRPLYAALIDRCRDAGHHSLIGGIALPNAGSLRLHESLGFEPVGTFRQVGWKFGAWHDVVFYQLLLGGPAAPGPERRG